MGLPTFRMPRRFLRGNAGPLALTVTALACGVALVCAIDLVNRAVLRACVEVLDTMAGRAALQVTTGGSGAFAEVIAEAVARVPGVEVAVPVVAASAFTTDHSGELLTVHGVDVADERAIRVYEAHDDTGVAIDDPLALLNQPDSIIVTRAFAARRGLAMGSTLALATPTGRREFTVRGLLEPRGIARVYGGNLLLMDLVAAQRAFLKDGFVNRLDLVVSRDARVAEVAAAVQRQLPAGLKVESPAQRQADLHAVMRSLHLLLQGMALVGLVAAFLIAFNRLSTMFDARLWQLAVLRAVGLRPRVVWTELLKESALLGAAGVLLGIPLGLALGRLTLPIIATTTALNYKIVAPEAELTIEPYSILLATAMGMLAALLAAGVPAWRAAHGSLAGLIRSRGTEVTGSDTAGLTRTRWAVRAAVAAGIGAALLAQRYTQDAIWGLVATALIAVATALVARPLLRVLDSPMLLAIATGISPLTRYGIRGIRRNSRRSALTVAMLGVGLGTVLWLGMLGHSFRASVLRVMPGVLRGDLAVSSIHIASGFVEAPVADLLVDELRRLPGIAAVAGEQAVDWQHAGGPIALNAFDPPYFADPAFGTWPLIGARDADALERVARGEGVIVSTNFVMHLGAGVGDTLTLATPSGPLSVPITAVTADFLSPRGTVEMSRDLYKRYWKDDQVMRALVRAAPGTDITQLRADIAAALGERYSLRILDARELLEYFETQVRRAFVPLDILAAMALLVILLGMADTLAAVVIERTRELGVLRAVGVPRGALRRLILMEGLLLGMLGLVLAIGAGIALGTLWVDATFPYLLGWVLELEFPMHRLLLVVMLTLLVCLMAALVPARRAAQLQPAAALRYE